MSDKQCSHYLDIGQLKLKDDNLQELITTGFVRSCFKDNHLFVPMVIIELCSKFYKLPMNAAIAKWIIDQELLENTLYVMAPFKYNGYQFFLKINKINTENKTFNLCLDININNTNYSQCIYYELHCKQMNRSIHNIWRKTYHATTENKFLFALKCIDYSQIIKDNKKLMISCIIDFLPLSVTLIFSQYISNPLQITFDANWTGHDLILNAVKLWMNQRGKQCPLKSTNVNDYEIRCWDEDEKEIDFDIPRFNTNLKICNFGETMLVINLVNNYRINYV